MRVLAALIAPLLLASCAGHLADYVGPRASIVSPQLIRYGFDLAQTRCVGDILGETLTPRQLRLFVRAAGAVRQGYFEPERLGTRDFLWVATTMRDPAVRRALDSALRACGVAVAVTPPPVAAQTAGDAPRPPAWLNLGAAGSGQSIAIDAATIDQADTIRTAWFRLTDPGAAASSDIFRLEIDCAGRTINATERHRLDAEGAIVERREYPDNPLPVEEGTVMQIAYLSLCT